MPAKTPTTVPSRLRDMLLSSKSDWNSPAWTQLFKDTLSTFYKAVLSVRH